MAVRDIRSILVRVVPVAVPIWLWGMDVHSQDLQSWTVELDDTTQRMLMQQASLSLDQCYTLCGTDVLVRCSLHPASGPPQLDCVGPTDPNGFHNGTGCSCGTSSPPKPADLASKPSSSDMPSSSYPPSSTQSSNGCGGRRPIGQLDEPDDHTCSDGDARLGRYVARQAHLEAASVFAFRQLEHVLRTLHAPQPLIESARCAARDEIRHARTLRQVARRYGAAVPRVRVQPQQEITRLDLALSNLREGCIGETYGAAVARTQAMSAADPDLRAQMMQIAEEETQHAELAFAIDDWLRDQLDDDDRRQLDVARDAAVRALTLQAAQPVHPALVTQLGIPSAAHATHLVQALAAIAWA